MTWIDGSTYVPMYLNEHHAEELLRVIDECEWLSDLKRRVQHYGYKYDYKKRRVDTSMYLGPLPAWAHRVAVQLHRDDLMAAVADQLIVNEYMPGQGISAHIDCEPCFGDTIVTVSLGSACEMDFIHVETKD